MSYRVLLVIHSASRATPEYMVKSLGEPDEFRDIPVTIIKQLDVEIDQFSCNLLTCGGFRARTFETKLDEQQFRDIMADQVWTIQHNGLDGIMITGNDGRDDFFIYKINC